MELFLNGVSLGRKPAGEAAGFDVSFPLNYVPGELTAVGYTNGAEDGRFTLKTAGSPGQIRVTTDKTVLSADGRGAAYITVELTDENGTLSPWEAKNVTVTVDGAARLAGLGSADPQAEGSYQHSTWKTFGGRVLAVVRAGTQPGNVLVRISVEDCGKQEIALSCR